MAETQTSDGRRKRKMLEYVEMSPEVLPTWTSDDELKSVRKVIDDRLQLYNCLGALDGKYVKIKKTNSSWSGVSGGAPVSLLAVVDGDYKFQGASVGFCPDQNIWNRSMLKQRKIGP